MFKTPDKVAFVAAVVSVLGAITSLNHETAVLIAQFLWTAINTFL
jgi:hypothetical protein